MRLAAQMACSLEELGERISAEEFGLWLAFNDEEPLGATALQIAVAQIRAAIANGPLQPPGGRKSFSASDFFSKRWEAVEAAAPREPTPEEIEAYFNRKAKG